MPEDFRGLVESYVNNFAFLCHGHQRSLRVQCNRLAAVPRGVDSVNTCQTPLSWSQKCFHCVGQGLVIFDHIFAGDGDAAVTKQLLNAIKRDPRLDSLKRT